MRLSLTATSTSADHQASGGRLMRLKKMEDLAAFRVREKKRAAAEEKERDEYYSAEGQWECESEVVQCSWLGDCQHSIEETLESQEYGWSAALAEGGQTVQWRYARRTSLTWKPQCYDRGCSSKSESCQELLIDDMIHVAKRSSKFWFKFFGFFGLIINHILV